ncbi:hypothetical protein ABMA27_006045 [Loxostege sticticalis]|uniref:Uncharacterized protein n=1 Tax=Loxostege sticticalis TaxID=481309 RepID=A0ABR3HHE9_LOXSC
MSEEKKSLLIRLAPFSRNFLYVFSCLLHKMSNFDPSFFELTASENILPEKSKSRYISTYDEFIANWEKITQSINLRSSPSPSHVEENVRPSTSVDNDNSSGQIPSTSKRHLNMQPKTSPVSIKNCSNFNVFVKYNFYKK